jgi:hypothetical protein
MQIEVIAELDAVAGRLPGQILPHRAVGNIRFSRARS